MISSDIVGSHLQSESIIQEMADTEDTWLAAGAGISVAVFGLCVLVPMIRRCYARPSPLLEPVVLLKQSRSDTDLENMLSDAIPSSSRNLPPNFVQ
jgi:hypothetical protein